MNKILTSYSSLIQEGHSGKESPVTKREWGMLRIEGRVIPLLL